MQTQAPGGGKTEEFRTLMQVENLRVPDVAALMERSVKTVYGWRNGKPVAIPDSALRLLKRLCAERRAHGERA